MVTLHDIMSHDVITLTPDATVREAMEVLATRHVSGVPVVSGGEVVGIVSSSDLLTLAGALRGVPLDPRIRASGLSSILARPEWSPLDAHTVSEAMSASIVSLPPDADVAQAAELMVGSHIHRVLVMDGRRLVGIVSAFDVAKTGSAVGEPVMTVREIMTPDVVTIAPELSVRAAMQLLAGRHISGAPVTARRTILGVVSATDLMDFAASLPSVPTERIGGADLYESEPALEWEEGAESPAAYFAEMWSDAGAELEERFEQTQGPEWDALEEHTVAEAMNRHVCSLPPTAIAATAVEYMSRAGVHRILVMDGGNLLGIVSMWDIVRAVIGRPLEQSARAVRAKARKRESGSPGGGAGRRDPVGESGVYPVSAGPTPSGRAEIRTPAAWGQGTRGAAGYEDAGGSELVMRDGQLLGGLTAGPSGEPTIDIHTPAPGQPPAAARDETRHENPEPDTPHEGG